MITRGQVVPVPILLNTCTGSIGECTNQTSAPCASAATVQLSSITAKLTRGSTIFTGTAVVQQRAKGFTSKTETVNITVPSTAPIGNYTISCIASVTFSGDSNSGVQTYDVSGDSEVSVGDDVTLPFLQVEALHNAVDEAKPDEVFPLKYRIRNNTDQPVTFAATINSKQSAHLPKIKANPHGSPVHTFSFAEKIDKRGFLVDLVIGDEPPVLKRDHDTIANIHLGPKGSATDTIEIKGATQPLADGYNGSCSEYVLKAVGSVEHGASFDFRVGSALIRNSNPRWWEFFAPRTQHSGRR